jgi:flagellar protein FliL
MKALFVLILGLILLGGAAFASWTLYQRYIAGEHAEEAPPPPPPAPPAYIRVTPVVVPLIGDKKVSQFVTVVATLQVDQPKQLAIQASLPRIQNAMLEALFAMGAEGKILRGTLVDIPAVKERLVEAVKPALPDGGLQDVLIQVVMQRNL